jgi:RNA polymerase sigma-54 factor
MQGYDNMKIGFELNLQQTQKLIMTPELRQAIQVLQYNNIELREYIEKQIESNPFLEVGDKPSDIIQEKQIDKLQDKPEAKKDEIDWQEVVERYDDISYKSYNYDHSENKQTFESYTAKAQSLNDHLRFQLGLSVNSKKDRMIGERIIDSLDRKGYLAVPVSEISEQLKVTEQDVENVLTIFHTFDPTGIAARNLNECLKIQLKERGVTDEKIFDIIDFHIENLACNKIQCIAKELNISVKKVQEICDMIRFLEPKPSRGFVQDSDNIKYISADVTITKVGDEYVIIVNDSDIPLLRISTYYKEIMKNVDDKDTNKFLYDKFNASMWLIKSIEQRRNTMYKVAESILKYQIDFFEKGEQHLKPLVLKDVAEDISVHESTVSRATNGKYVQTPRGLFELKYFFSSSISKEGDDDGMASTSIKSLIQELVSSENEKKPLSDQKIADELNKKGIDISRRTIAKYRDELGISASSMRKRF